MDGKNEISEVTKCDYKRVIKQFFKWLKKDDDSLYSTDVQVRVKAKKFYEFIEDMSKEYKVKQADPAMIITGDDIRNVVANGAKTAKEKAFLMLLHESGCRAAEFLNLRVGDISIRYFHAVIQVPDGKTGRRTIFAVNSIPYLKMHLELHPFRHDSSSFLWLSDNRRNLHEPILHNGGQKIINRCFKRAKVLKKHNYHWFRHSRATILAPKITEVMLCKYLGWVLGSKQVKIYGHLCVKQLEDVYRSMMGVKKEEENKDKPISCLCWTLNPSTELYRHRRYKPLRVETAIQQSALRDNEMVKITKLLMKILQDPELLAKFQKFKEGLE